MIGALVGVWGGGVIGYFAYMAWRKNSSIEAEFAALFSARDEGDDDAA